MAKCFTKFHKFDTIEYQICQGCANVSKLKQNVQLCKGSKILTKLCRFLRSWPKFWQNNAYIILHSFYTLFAAQEDMRRVDHLDPDARREEPELVPQDFSRCFAQTNSLGKRRKTENKVKNGRTRIQ